MLSEHSHVTLVGGDGAIVLTKWFFGMRVCFSGNSLLVYLGAVRIFSVFCVNLDINLDIDLDILIPFHVTLVGGDDTIVLTRWFFGMLVCFSGSSCLMFFGAVSSSLNFWYPFGPFFHVTLAGDDDAIVLTKSIFQVLLG